MARGPERLVVGDRVLVSRAELARVTGMSVRALAKLWGERTRNGHPDVEVIDGHKLYDLDRWRVWRDEHDAPRRMIEGRPHVSVAELSRMTGEPVGNLEHWYAQRADNGHPDAVHLGRHRYVDEQNWHHWHARHVTTRQEGLTHVDRAGDPDELIAAAEVARVLGYRSVSTLTGYIARNQFIEPDETTDLPSSGRVRRRWTRRHVWEFAEQRSWSRKPSTPETTSSDPAPS